MSNKSISVSGPFYEKLKAAAKERDLTIAAIVEAAVAPDLEAIEPVIEAVPPIRRRKSP